MEASWDDDDVTAKPEADEEDMESVEVDHARGLANVSRIQDVLAGQQSAYNRILAKILEEDEVASVTSQAARSASAPGKPARYVYEESKAKRKDGMFNPTRMRGSCEVANELQRDKFQKDRFQRRRRQCMQEVCKKNEAQLQVHEADEKRARLREQELIERQAEKTLVAQHRRMEQHKMLHEMRKMQDKEFELLQQKVHPSENPSDGSQPGSPRSPKQAPEAPKEPVRPLPKSEAEEYESGVLECDVYKKAVESHNLYDSTLTKWRGFVAENEKRTEVYWQKKLEDPDAKHKRDRSNSKRSCGLNLFKKSVKDVASARKFLSMSKAISALDAPGSALEGGWNEEDFSAGPSQSLTSPNTSKSLSALTPGLYAGRLEQAKRYQAELEEQARQKKEADLKFNQEKRRKGQEEQAKKSQAAEEYNAGWKDRNDAYAERRRKNNIQSDNGMGQRLIDQKARAEEMEAQRDEEIRDMADNRQMRSDMTRDTGQENVDRAVSNTRDNLHRKDRMGAAFLRGRQDYAAERQRQDMGTEAKCEEMRSQKKANDRAFSRSTTMDIDRKQKRHEQAKYLNHKPKTPHQAFQRYRKLANLKAGTVRETPPELTLLPGWEMPQDISLDDLEREEGSPQWCSASPKSPFAGDASMVSMASGPSPHSEASMVRIRAETAPAGMSMWHSKSLRISPGKGEEGSDLPATALEVRKLMKGRSTISEASPNAKSPYALGREQDRESAVNAVISMGERAIESRRMSLQSAAESDDNQDHHEEFLMDLESRTRGWLTQLRKDYE